MEQLTTENMDGALLEAARTAKDRAYAPFSNFCVGAAVRTTEGEVSSGCNVENASYGLSMCAERVAIFSAIACGARRIQSLAVSTNSDPSSPTESRMPCGACRQVMAEFMDRSAKVFVDEVGVFELSELLPIAFELTATR